MARRGGFWFIGEFAFLFFLFGFVVLCDWICRSGNCNWMLEGFSLLVYVLRIVVEVGKSSDASLLSILQIFSYRFLRTIPKISFFFCITHAKSLTSISAPWASPAQ